jgi:hypothetical protein
LWLLCYSASKFVVLKVYCLASRPRRRLDEAVEAMIEIRSKDSLRLVNSACILCNSIPTLQRLLSE